MKFFQWLTICILAWTGLTSCQDTTQNYSHSENGIYYWRTTFAPNDYEKTFVKKHNVKKLYIKFFDVGSNWRPKSDEYIVPEATVQFKDTLFSDLEVVPTIYITTSAIEAMQLEEDRYAEKILKRVNAMCRQNQIKFNELQLDCDWTKHTQKYFYRLCEEIKQLLDTTQILSSTIRLHQLTQTPPPVDKGVLMVYNTGNLMELSTENSIFSRKDIEPYLHDNRLSNYSLPLDVAYPAYGWSLVFHPGKDKYLFNRIMRRTDVTSYPQLKKIDKNTYEATEEINFTPDENYWNRVYKGYRIKVERPTAQEILEVKRLIEQQLAGKPHDNILYHLDETQLSNYSDNEISEIYSRN